MLRVLSRNWRLLLLLSGIIASVLVEVRHIRRDRSYRDLRDAVSSDPPLSPGHAGLARDGRSACGYCHVDVAALPSNHARWGGVGWERGVPAVPDTAVCLSCHDGALASEASVHGPNSHPIGIDYALARQQFPDRFNDITAASEIRLEDGRIGCLSCHAIHRPADGSNRHAIIESSCQACHNR